MANSWQFNGMNVALTLEMMKIYECGCKFFTIIREKIYANDGIETISSHPSDELRAGYSFIIFAFHLSRQ